MREVPFPVNPNEIVMKTILETKTVSRYDYRTLGQIRKEFGKLPSPTKIFSTVDSKAHSYFQHAMKDKNSTIYKATRAGNRFHVALDSGNIQKGDDMTARLVDEFQNNIFPEIDEVWGQEMGLFHPSGYIGKFDGVGILRGSNTMWDYKRTNKRKTKSAMKKWFMQSVSYTDAHNFMYDSNIQQVAILNVYGKTPEEIGSEITILNTEEIAKSRADFQNYLSQYKEKVAVVS